MRVLVVEDEARIAKSLVSVMEGAGFRAELAGDGETAWFRAGTEAYDLIILDLGLPKLDGLSVLRRLRAEGCDTPVLILTARGSWTERVEGIDAGADDYLPKPFHMEELVARARALVRRAAGRASAVHAVGDLRLDTSRMTASRAGRPLDLTPLEFRLLSHLMLHRGRTLSPGELLEHLYGDDDAREANALEAVMARLRRKIGAGVIATRRGFGYRIDGDGA